MRRNAFVELALDEEGLPLLLREFDHRMRNLLTIMEATVRRTQSSNVEDYRAKLIEPILGLRRLYQEKGRSYALCDLEALIEHTVRPHNANGARIVTSGPGLKLEPDLALALHLVFHELASNAKKYGALSSQSGRINIEWAIRQAPGAVCKLALVWSEQGGPQVNRVRNRGFGMQLIKRALEGYGGVRLAFNPVGLACSMILDLGGTLASRAERIGMEGCC